MMKPLIRLTQFLMKLMSSIVGKVGNKPARVVGYSPSKKGKIKAIVVIDNKLHAVSLQDITLDPLPVLNPSVRLRMVGDESASAA